jgi:long-chain acyl-CoA synthetase
MLEDGRDLSNLITVIARFTTKGDPEAFERFFLDHVKYMKAQDGFGAHQAVRSLDNPAVYVNFGWWLGQEAFQKVVASDQFKAHQGVMHSMLEKADLDLCVNVARVNAAESAGTRGEFDTPLMNITTYRVTGDGAEFEAAFQRYAAHIRELHGFGYTDLNRSLRKPGTYASIGYWWDPAAYAKATGGEQYQALTKLADVGVEPVKHVAWGRGGEDDTAAETG